MIDDDDKHSFWLDPQANSFQLKGFRWNEAPLWLFCLLASVALITGLNFVADLGLSLLGRDVALFVCGASFGFLAGLWIGDFRTSRLMLASDRNGTLLPLSDRVKQIASDPTRKIEAIKAYREESGASLADAKQMVESYMNRDSLESSPQIMNG